MDQGRGKFLAARAHAAIIDHQNGNAIAHQDLVKEEVRATPHVADALPVRPAIRIIEQRNFLARAVRRQINNAAKHRAIFSLEVDKLRRDQIQRSTLFDRQNTSQLPPTWQKESCGGVMSDGKMVDKVLPVRRYRGLMRSALGQALKAAAIKLHAA